MPNVTLRNLPDRVYEIIQKRAVENHRSVNQEIIFCLERIAARKETNRSNEFLRINAAKRRGRP